MKRTLLFLLLSGFAAASLFVFPATSQEPVPGDPMVIAGRGKDKIVIAGTVKSAADADEDGKSDTFVIKTGEAGGMDVEKAVKNLTETDEMGVIEVGDHVEIECEVQPSGELKIVDVIQIGQ